MYVQNCDEFVSMMKVYLHETEVQRKALTVLSTLRVCTDYERIRTILKKTAKLEIKAVSRIDQFFQVITFYDNFEYTEKTDESHLH